MKLLMRAAKNPTTPISAIESLRTDTIGQNSGNLIFAAASHALISIEGCHVDTISSFKSKTIADAVNAEYDGVVLPLANCFRPAFSSELDNISSFIEKLDIPFAMLSGGAQIEDHDPSFEALRPIEESVRRFCRAVLEKSDKITVRGDATASYVNSLGFSAVDVIGCPSLTRMGKSFELPIRPDRIGNRIAYNVETSKDIMGPVIQELESNGAELTYIAQDIRTLDALLWARDTYPETRSSAQPVHLSHPHIQSGRIKFFVDASTWIADMAEYNLAIGPRIHGAISAISGSTPALLVAHDLRTRELAEYHAIPHISVDDLNKIRSVDDVWNEIDYAEFNRVREHQVAKVVQHLEVNGFSTTLSDGREKDREQYFAKISRINFPKPVRAPEFDLNDERFAETRRKNVALTERFRALERRLTALEDRLRK